MSSEVRPVRRSLTIGELFGGRGEGEASRSSAPQQRRAAAQQHHRSPSRSVSRRADPGLSRSLPVRFIAPNHCSHGDRGGSLPRGTSYLVSSARVHAAPVSVVASASARAAPRRPAAARERVSRAGAARARACASHTVPTDNGPGSLAILCNQRDTERAVCILWLMLGHTR
eukprot:COSAG02_NODE_38_length_48090_cov_107.207060_5_plen_171_part_00